MNYSIYMESTPNPAVMKFVANRMLVDKSVEFLNSEDAKSVPIAKALFNFPFIKNVFLSTNFISITKNDSVNWEDVAIQLRMFILDKLNSEGIKNHAENLSLPVEKNKNNKKETTVFKTEIEQQIISILEQYIKPAVEADGGYIELKSFKNGLVTVSLKGACSGCPSSQMTLKNGIEVLLKNEFPEKINTVIAINN